MTSFSTNQVGDPITSLSSQVLKSVVESDLLVASKSPLHSFSESESRLGIQEQVNLLFGREEKRWVISYGLHNGIATVARVVAAVATYALVAPVGVFYHAGQALYHRDVKHMRDLHLKCANLELARVATLAGFVFLYRFSDFLFNLAKQDPNVLSAFALPFIPAALDIGATIFCPTFNSRVLDAPLDDVDFRAKMALKWEFGLQLHSQEGAKNLLDACIQRYAKGVLKNIEELQKVLPEGHRLPCDPEEPINVHNLLRHLERSCQKLDQRTLEQVLPYKAKLVEYNKGMLKLYGYSDKDSGRTFPDFDPQEIRKVFTLDGSYPLEMRPLPQTGIHSLTQGLFKQMLASDFFCPSDYEPQRIEDQGSIAYTMRTFDPYCNRRKKSQVSFKILRVIARSLAGTGIAIVGCTAGTAYHGTQAFYCLTKFVLASPEAKFGNWERVQAHAFAALNDLASIAGVIGLLFPYIESVRAIALSREDRAGIVTAHLLKEHFGIVAEDGQLLSYSWDDDVSEGFKENRVLERLHRLRSQAFWEKIGNLERQGIDVRSLQQSIGMFSQSGVSWLFMHALRDLGVGKEEQEQYRHLFSDLLKLREIGMQAMKLTEESVFSSNRAHITFYPYLYEAYKQPELDGFTESLSATRSEILRLNISDAQNNKYREMKARVLDPQATPRSILNFSERDPITEASVNRRFRVLSLAVHPDKHAGKDTETEAGKLFTVVSNAKDFLLEEDLAS